MLLIAQFSVAAVGSIIVFVTAHNIDNIDALRFACSYPLSPTLCLPLLVIRIF
jgi:hypothetical protein